MAGTEMVRVGENVYVPRLVPVELMNAWFDPDMVTGVLVMFVVGSAPDPAVTVLSTIDILLTAMVRWVVSTEPAALTNAVELMVADQLAPVPRASTRLHGEAGVATVEQPAVRADVNFARGRKDRIVDLVLGTDKQVAEAHPVVKPFIEPDCEVARRVQ